MIAFTSSNGKFGKTSMHSVVKLDNLKNLGEKITKGKIPTGEDFKKATETMNDLYDLTSDGIKTGDKLVASIVEGGIKGLINSARESSPLISTNSVSGNSGIGNNNSVIIKTHNHIGWPTTKRLKGSKNYPNVDLEVKELSSSSKDYQEHKKRKNLTLKSGFEQKGFCFMMEDSYLSLKDLENLYLKNNPERRKTISKTKNGKRQSYGAMFKTINEFKIMNRMEYYNASVRIHLLKLNDFKQDPRSLVRDITNNRYNTRLSSENEKSENEDKNYIKEKRIEQIIEIIQEIRSEKNSKTRTTEDKNKGIPLKTINNIKNEILKFGNEMSQGYKFDTINEEEQYSDPDIMDLENKITLDFKTSIKTKLTDSTHFKSRARIVKTWNRVLTPGSMWDFKLEHHLGKGIHLNYLNDIIHENPNHPMSYTFIIEYLGDARGKVVREKDNDIFMGYSPARLNLEFSHKICYLNDFSKNQEEGMAYAYRTKRNEEDFEEDSEFAKLFCPNRESKMNINFEDIKLREDNKKKEYMLEYDVNILNESMLLNQIKSTFKNAGLNTDNLSEDDHKFNTTEFENHTNIEDEI